MAIGAMTVTVASTVVVVVIKIMLVHAVMIQY